MPNSINTNGPPKPVISLCFDVDNTVICRPDDTAHRDSLKQGIYDINGLVLPIRLVEGIFSPATVIYSVWYYLVSNAQMLCNNARVELNVHIITAKSLCSKLEDLVVILLHPFLQELSLNSFMVHHGKIPEFYWYNQYVGKKINLCSRDNVYCPVSSSIHFVSSELLPSVHIINTYDKNAPSKAYVMQYIKDKLEEIGKESVGMILVDDSPNSHQEEVEQKGFSFISAEKLRSESLINNPWSRADIVTQEIQLAVYNEINQLINRYYAASALAELSQSTV